MEISMGDEIRLLKEDIDRLRIRLGDGASENLEIAIRNQIASNQNLLISYLSKKGNTYYHIITTTTPTTIACII
jgi:hypothetical protein